MNNHRFDPTSAVLGVIAVIAGLFVALGRPGDTLSDSSLGVWLAVAALGLGLALVPWGRRRSPDRDASPDSRGEPPVSRGGGTAGPAAGGAA